MLDQNFFNLISTNQNIYNPKNTHIYAYINRYICIETHILFSLDASSVPVPTCWPNHSRFQTLKTIHHWLLYPLVYIDTCFFSQGKVDFRCQKKKSQMIIMILIKRNIKWTLNWFALIHLQLSYDIVFITYSFFLRSS